MPSHVQKRSSGEGERGATTERVRVTIQLYTILLILAAVSTQLYARIVARLTFLRVTNPAVRCLVLNRHARWRLPTATPAGRPHLIVN